MNPFLYVIFFAVSFLASTAGAICGIGGGVVIKPVLDAFGVLSVASISFLSGCTVLSMSCYNVIRSISGHDSLIDMRTGTSLAFGAAIGGIVGKSLFSYIQSMSASTERVGAIQASCLLLVTFGTLIYTINKDSIKTYHITDPLFCIVIGLFLGMLSSFLGIGGGPINLVVLYFFFSMDTKTAAQNSIYIILFSQLTSLISTIVTHSVPDFTSGILLLMIFGGIFGGICGRAVNKKINARTVSRLFIVLMAIIMIICAYNIVRYTFY